MSAASPDVLVLAGDCVDLARRQVRGPWLRASPLLLRQAVETAVTRRLQDAGVSAGASMRAKLLCLVEVAGPEVGSEAAWLWERLSECCHYGPYELDATLDELTDWSTRCQKLVDALGGLE